MRPVLALICVVGLVAFLSACSSEFSDSDVLFRAADTSGSIEVPLTGADAAGRQYHLRGATFEVSGDAMVTLSDSTQARSLSTPLPTGGYQMYLRPGYQVVEIGLDGSERTIAAALSSANPASFHVGPHTSGRLRLSFRHGDVSIAFGGREPARHAVGALAIAR